MYKCCICDAEFIMPTDCLKAKEVQGKYIACPFGHKHIERMGQFGDLKACQEGAHVYKRVKGRIKQVK